MLLEHTGFPSCFWVFAMRNFCFMVNTGIDTEGGSPWNRRRQKGNFDQDQRYLFGCTVDFMSRPDEVKAQPKFAPPRFGRATCWISCPTWRSLER